MVGASLVLSNLRKIEVYDVLAPLRRSEWWMKD